MNSLELRFPQSLVDIDLGRLPIYCTDVLVLGSGIAGLSTALEASRRRDVLLVTKAPLKESNTAWAQGGIAAVLSEADSFKSHFDDTEQVGQGLCEDRIVDLVTSRGPQALAALETLGAVFDRRPDGSLDLQREGGHSHARVVHSNGDLTGREIERALADRAVADPRIHIFENTYVVDLIRDEGGVCVGAIGWRRDVGFVGFISKSTVLATGGAGWLYRETTNPPIATADGIAAAFRAGAAVRDLEFMQFHPTTLYVAGAGRLLVSEIVRGKGGMLVDRNGYRFMFDYHPAGELAPRDVVSRAIGRHMVKTRDTSAYLDLSKIEGDVKTLFPNLADICRFFEIDISRDRIPVRPAAHYCVGGVEVDEFGRTTIPGLHAVGEVASSGLHGANRIGSNSLLEGAVFGKIVGELVSTNPDGPTTIPKFVHRRVVRRSSGAVRLDLDDVAYSVRSLMTRLVGVERSGDGLEEATARLDGWIRYLFAFELDHPRAFEVANIVTVARLVAQSALFRTESRGTHYRTDFPERDDVQWRAHSRVVPGAGCATWSLQPLQS
jgi:L-aspartate oxidase